MFRADLHCHSTCSDGSLTPEELVMQAKAIGLSGLSITDHDTITAYQTAVEAARKAGLLLGSGVEFSCGHKGMNVHILGYDFELHNAGFNAFCERHRTRRKERNRAILKKLAQHNMPIPEIELEEKEKLHKTIGRPHIAELMVAKGYVPTIREAFMLYIGDGKRCYDPGHFFSIEETITIIRQAGGKAFLAHPHLIDRRKIIEELLAMPFQGIECFYSKSPPEKEARWLRMAKEKKLLISGGSDFHGASKPGIPLGCSWVNEEVFNQIFQRRL